MAVVGSPVYLYNPATGEPYVAGESNLDAFGSQKVVLYKPDGTALEYNDLIDTKVVKAAITVDTAAYADGDCIGGLVTLTDFARVSEGSGTLTRFNLRTVLNVSAQIFIHIFDENPSASTFTDNAALVIHANDRRKLLKTIPIAASGDWVAPKGASPWYTFEAIDPPLSRANLDYDLPTGRALYFALEADGAVDFVTAADLEYIVGAQNN